MMELTEYDYGYLAGDEVMWHITGAAFNCVAEDCYEAGYGTFGNPTERGKEAMSRYEQELKDNPCEEIKYTSF